jgi:mRNA interferase MazF
MISSQLDQNIAGLDDLISTTDTDFAQKGLTKESIIRVSRIAIVSQSVFLGKIGAISPQRLAHIKISLANWIQH